MSQSKDKAKGPKKTAKVTTGAQPKDWSQVDADEPALDVVSGQDDVDEHVQQDQAAPIPEVKQAAAPPPTVEAMERMKQQLDEYKEIMLRAEAKVENMRQRTQKEVERAHAFGLERFVKALLPVADSLEQAMAGSDTAQADDGLKITHDLLLKVLADFGVEKVGVPGEAFDANIHEAMSLQEAEGMDSNTVVSVVRTGYRLNGRSVRPAMVIVAK